MTELLIGIFIGYAVGSFIVLAFYRMQDGFWTFHWMQDIENKIKDKK